LILLWKTGYIELLYSLRIALEIRRVQVTGGNSFVVSLPKSWVKDVGLKAKDSVQVLPQADMSLLIVPTRDFAEAEKSEATIEITQETDKDAALRLFISYYLAGYDIVRLRSARYDPGLRSYMREAIRRKLVGIEIIEENANGMTTQCLSGYADLPLKKALERMSIVVSGMVKDAVAALHAGDDGLAEEVVARDDEVDRFYHFILRQLNLAVRNRSIIENIGLTSARDCLGYRLAVKSVERVGDHAAAVAGLVSGVRQGAAEKAMKEVEKMSDLSLKAFGDSVSSLLRLDRKLANEAIGLTRRVKELDEKISGELLALKTDPDTFGSIKLILESIRRVGEYGSDIAEIAVDLTVKEP